MDFINSGGRNLGGNPTPLGSDFKNQQMYSQYLDLWNHFNNIGLPEMADELTMNMEQQYAVSGGTQPMLDSFQNIKDGGMGGYSQEQFDVISGGINPSTGQAKPVAVSAQAEGFQPSGTGLNGAQVAGQVANTTGQVANTLQDPNKDAVQKGIGAGGSVLGGLGALGVGGMAVPVIGAGLGIAGAVYDYNKNMKAQQRMENAMREEKARRDIASAKYNKELDKDYARRELGFRGQTQGLPMYQAMMAQSGKNFSNQQQANQDMLQKTGQSDKSGMAGQLASQNFGNLSKNISKATKDSVTGMGRAYGGLQGMAVSGRPEQSQYAFGNKMYNESNNFGENLRPITNLAGAYGKKKAHDAGMYWMEDDYYGNVNKGGV